LIFSFFYPFALSPVEGLPAGQERVQPKRFPILIKNCLLRKDFVEKQKRPAVFCRPRLEIKSNGDKTFYVNFSRADQIRYNLGKHFAWESSSSNTLHENNDRILF